jgi:hypothetical protein
MVEPIEQSPMFLDVLVRQVCERRLEDLDGIKLVARGLQRLFVIDGLMQRCRHH